MNSIILLIEQFKLTFLKIIDHTSDPRVESLKKPVVDVHLVVTRTREILFLKYNVFKIDFSS